MDLSIYKTLNPCNNLIRVDQKSDIGLHEEVFKIAKYFTEELNYSTVPYSPLGIRRQENIALLFTAEAMDLYKTEPVPYRIFGACCFSKKTLKKARIIGVLNGYGCIHFFVIEGILKSIGSI